MNDFQPATRAVPDRYIRQIRFAPLGQAGQQRLAASTVLVCGCGALGSTLANLLVRAGVGNVRIVDRDVVDLTNLPRQVLFDEADAAAAVPKAVAAAEKLRRINSSCNIEPVIADLQPSNIEQLCSGVDVIVDGTDNFETRFLVNDYAVYRGIPWVYGGCIGADGQTMTIIPGQTACLRCLIPECPPPGSTPTCDTEGILGPTVGVVASLEAIEALKILSGNRSAVSRWLTVVELWEGRIHQVDVSHLRDSADCPTCKHRQFWFLARRQGSQAAVLCGRNAVQLSFDVAKINLEELAARLAQVGEVTRNQYLLRLKVEQFELTVFPDARVIVSGSDDPATARTVCAKYIGL